MRAEHFKTVCSLDPAIDTERMTLDVMRRFIESRDFDTILQYLQPGKATIFHLREVPASLWDSYVDAALSESEKFRRAFACGVTRVENLYQDDGVALPTWSPVGKLSGEQVMSDAEVASRFRPYEWEEIGGVVYRHSFFPRRIAVSYRLRSLSLELLGHRPFLSADASQNSAE